MKINLDDTKFLGKDDVQHKSVLMIQSEGVWQDSNFKDEDGNPQKEFRIHFQLGNGETRSTSLRSSNVSYLVQSLETKQKSGLVKKLELGKQRVKRPSLVSCLFTPRQIGNEMIRENGLDQKMTTLVPFQKKIRQ